MRDLMNYAWMLTKMSAAFGLTGVAMIIGIPAEIVAAVSKKLLDVSNWIVDTMREDHSKELMREIADL